MSIYDVKPMSFEKIKTYELETRPSKVTVADFAKVSDPTSNVSDFLETLPNILAAKDLREFVERLKRAREAEKPIIWGFGGHVIKTGLAPILIDLMDEGFVSAISVNGSVLVHDSEIAFVGFTSEDVDSTLGSGDFGAALETGELLNGAAQMGLEKRIGLGEAMCELVSTGNPRFAAESILCASYRRRIPLTAHITIGADIGHFHPSASGTALGAGSHLDFKLFCSLIKGIDGGGVYINFGSAVTMPEIFLKAITINRNLGHPVKNITTANFDFIQNYRPLTNVVRRPTANGAGKGFAFTGHHELMLPLLASALKS